MQTLFVLVVMIVFALGAASRADAQQPAAAPQKGAEKSEPECRAKPGGVAPEGQRWAYRTNRTIKRRCWFLTDQSKETSRKASSKRTEPRVKNPRTVELPPRRVVASDPYTDEPGADQAEQNEQAAELAPPPAKPDGVASPTPPRLQAQNSAGDPAWSAQPHPARPQPTQPQPTPASDPFLAEPIGSAPAELAAADDRAPEVDVAERDTGAAPPPLAAPVESSASAVNTRAAKNAPKPQPSSTLLLALLFGSFAVAAASIHGIVRIVR